MGCRQPGFDVSANHRCPSSSPLPLQQPAFILNSFANVLLYTTTTTTTTTISAIATFVLMFVSSSFHVKYQANQPLVAKLFPFLSYEEREAFLHKFV